MVAGTVKPASATVTVDGEIVAAGGGSGSRAAQQAAEDATVDVEPDGSFSVRLRLPDLGENQFRFNGSVRGRRSDSEHTTVVRELTAREVAVRRERARQRRIRIAEARERRRQEQIAREAQERENFIAAATAIDYDQLAKNPDDYRGTKVAYTGQIFQIQEDYGTTWMLLSVTDMGYGIWDDNIWVDYPGEIQGAEEDIITIYGVVKGEESYETQIGGQTYVPKVAARYVSE